MVGSHHAALLYRIVEQCQGSSSAVGTTNLQTHLLQDSGNTVAHRRGRCQAQIHNTKRHTQSLGSLHAHQLTHTGDPEGGLFNGFCHHIKGLTLDALKGVINNAGAGNAHIELTFRLAYAVECACHKGVILHSIGKYHQFRTAKAVVFLGDISGLFDDLAHFGYGIHIDTGLGRTHIDAGADISGLGHCLGNGIHQDPVALGTTLLHQSRKAANKVDAASLCRLIHSDRQRYVGISITAVTNDGDRSYRDPLVDDGNAKLPLDLLADLHQILCTASDLVVDLPGADLDIRVRAIQQGNTHSDCTDIQVALVDHILGG